MAIYLIMKQLQNYFFSKIDIGIIFLLIFAEILK